VRSAASPVLATNVDISDDESSQEDKTSNSVFKDEPSAASLELVDLSDDESSQEEIV